MPRTLPKRCLHALAATVAMSAGLLPAAPAGALPGHHPNPSAQQLARSRSEVAARERQLRVAERRLGRARVRLTHARQVAEIAAERYDAARTKLTAAQQRLAADQKTLAAATAATHRAQQSAQRFAVAAYESGGVQGIDIVSGEAAVVVSRIGTEQAISIRQQQAVQRLAAAQIVQATLTRQAQQAKAVAAQAAAVAAKAFASAKSAAQAAEHQFRTVAQQRSRVQALLTAAQAHARKLRREHLAALARAAARAAARAEAARLGATPAGGGSPYTGTTGNLGNTVSAATEAQAVKYAESQIGKPYQWGAAGPDSYDCSGLTMWAYAQVGVHLLHYTGYQWVEGAHVATSDLRPGDLVFFATNTSDPSTIHHVGMYIGNGQMVDAPYTGADVRIEAATSRPDYIGAVRPYR